MNFISPNIETRNTLLCWALVPWCSINLFSLALQSYEKWHYIPLHPSCALVLDNNSRYGDVRERKKRTCSWQFTDFQHFVLCARLGTLWSPVPWLNINWATSCWLLEMEDAINWRWHENEEAKNQGNKNEEGRKWRLTTKCYLEMSLCWAPSSTETSRGPLSNQFRTYTLKEGKGIGCNLGWLRRNAQSGAYNDMRRCIKWCTMDILWVSDVVPLRAFSSRRSSQMCDRIRHTWMASHLNCLFSC